MVTPHISYSGSCKVNGTQIFCREVSVNIESKPTFYDHTIGLQESKKGIVVNGISKAGTKIQKKYYRYSPVLPKASISGPLTVKNLNTLLGLAEWGGSSGGNVIDGVDVEVVMWKNGVKQTLKSAFLQTLSIDIRAGDVASFSADFVGKDVDTATGQAVMEIAVQERLLTWDAIRISLAAPTYDNPQGGEFFGSSGSDWGIASFSISVNNPVGPIYTANTANIYPKELRLGIQDTTGSISIYGVNSFLQAHADINMAVGMGSSGGSLPDSATYKFHVAFEPPSDKASSTAIYLSNINFACFSDTGRPWYKVA